MSDTRSPDSGTALETVRVSSGRPARIGAFAVAGLLVTVIWIAVSGQPAAPRSVAIATPQATGLVSALESATAAPPASEVPRAGPTRPPDSASASGYHFLVVATFGGRQFMTVLEEDEAGNLLGTMPVSAPLSETEGTLEFSHGWLTVSHDSWSEIGTWSLALGSLSAGSRGEDVVLDASMRPRRTIRNAPDPVVRGFRITVHARSLRGTGQLRIAVELGPRGQLQGNDGIFGWPVVSQLGQTTSAEDGLMSGCHWNGQPVPSRRPPYPTYDETSCE